MNDLLGKQNLVVRMEAILNEMVEYYSKDTSRRGVGSDGRCRYISDNQNCCAVGRHMKPAFLKSVTEELNKKSVSYLKNLDNALQHDARGLPLIFWKFLQELHDHDKYWSANGLTEKGSQLVGAIKQNLPDFAEAHISLNITNSEAASRN